VCGGVGDSRSRLSVDCRGDLGEDMMAAAGVGGALVAEAWANSGAALISSWDGSVCVR
jgi:hypothetical protein